MRRSRLTVVLLAVAACTQKTPEVSQDVSSTPVQTASQDSVTSDPTAAVTSVESTRTASAKQVMAAARSLCSIREEEPHLVVECTSSIAPEQQLAFAQAIANADVVLTGRARNIYYYLPDGRQFAQADRLNGIRLK